MQGLVSDVEEILAAAAGAEQRANRLRELEEVIDRGLETFVEVGRALQGIRDAQLYRATHTSFAEYVKERFGISRPHAYRLIDAAEVKVALSPIGDIRNEAQARELVPLWRKDPAEAEQLWRDAGADITTRDLKVLVTRRLGQMERVEVHGQCPCCPEAREPEPDETLVEDGDEPYGTELKDFTTARGDTYRVGLWNERSVLVEKRETGHALVIPFEVANEIANEIARIVEFNS